MKKTKVLITGSNGFLGKILCNKIRVKYEQIIEISRKDVDLTNYQQVIDMMTKYKPNLIYHLAADCGGISYNVNNPADLSHNNLIMTLNILKAAVEVNKPKIIMIGSVDSYPADADIPYNEKDIWNGFPEVTSAFYGLAKRMNLALGEAYWKQYRLETIHVLLMNLYGPGDHFDKEKGHVIPAIIKKIDHAMDNKKNEIKIYGDGSTIREFIFVEDAAELIIKAASLNGFQYFNLGSGQLMKIIDVLNIIKNQMGFVGSFKKDMNKPIGHQIKNFSLNKMRKLIGDYKFTEFETGIKLTINWYKVNKDKLNEKI